MKNSLIAVCVFIASTGVTHASTTINPNPGEKVSTIGNVVQTVNSTANNAWFSLVEQEYALNGGFGERVSNYYVVKHNFAGRVNSDAFGETYFPVETHVYVPKSEYSHMLNAQDFGSARGVSLTQMNNFDREIVITSRTAQDIGVHNPTNDVVFDTAALNLTDLYDNGKVGSFDLVATQYHGQANYYENEGHDFYSQHGLYSNLSQLDTSFDKGVVVALGLTNNRYRIEDLPLIQDTNEIVHPKYIYTTKDAYVVAHPSKQKYANSYQIDVHFPLDSNSTSGYKCTLDASFTMVDEVSATSDWSCARY
ncbi:hypothetical protein OCT63_18235 [Vibrio sp. RW]|uniref:hypothetical protein n=1 Tax=Vibrio sp. RW TaxID=2998833 RepID=UPI0022CD9013|nr:hypothetical protein [Vibrio sp. RW]MDA0146168.1 hypothetical protein [Vibrio sp. RW]